MKTSRPYLDNFDHDANRAKIRAFKNKHQGERCVIIGNGPSLNKTDMSLLKDIPTFGMNKIHLHFPVMGWKPTYYVATSPLVQEQCIDVIPTLPMPKFLSHEGVKSYPPSEDMAFLMSWNQEKIFSEDMTDNVWQGHTVTFCALQLAYYMGFSKVILVGVDHNFTYKGDPNELQYHETEDENHFHPDYFKGVEWHAPDLEMSELGYTLAREAFQKDGRKVVDATVGGKLAVFEKEELKTAISQ